MFVNAAHSYVVMYARIGNKDYQYQLIKHYAPDLHPSQAKQAKPNPSVNSGWGGGVCEDLPEAQVDVPLSVSHS